MSTELIGERIVDAAAVEAICRNDWFSIVGSFYWNSFNVSFIASGRWSENAAAVEEEAKR